MFPRRTTASLALAGTFAFAALSAQPAVAAGPHQQAGITTSLSSSAVSSLAASGLPPATFAPAAPQAAPHAGPLAAAEVPIPQADVLDVDFRADSTDDKAQGLKATVLGEPTTGADLTSGRTVMSFDGVDDGLQYPFRASQPKLATAMTLECSFRLDAERAATSPEGALCSSKESGGFATVLSKTDVAFMIHVGGGYKTVRTPITPGSWNHTVATWDGAQVSLYLNGELVQQVPAVGAYTAPKAGADSLMLGTDVSPSNTGHFFAPATLRTSRVWSSALTAEQARTLAAQDVAGPAAPKGDVLSVDFTSGGPVDAAQQLALQTFGDPQVRDDKPMGTKVAQFDGSGSAYLVPFAEQFPKLANQMSVECVFQYNDDFATDGSENRGNLCGAKESGGFSMTLYGNKLSFNPYINGGYRNTNVEVETGRWYHAVGTYDGKTVRLWVNGELAASTPVTGQLQPPSSAEARNLVIGGDASGRNRPAMFSPSTISRAQVFSRGLNADEVRALGRDAFAGRPANYRVHVESSTPAAGSTLQRSTRFDLAFTEPEGVARTVRYTLDGQEITLGQEIGTGLRKGTHEIRVEGTDVFGTPIRESIEFSTANVLSGTGSTTEQGKGKVTLSANAVNPSGGQVLTTFRKAAVVVAEKGRQGVLDELPTTLDFTGSEEKPLDAPVAPGDDTLATTPSTNKVPFQRFDVPVQSAKDQQVVWGGQVDPSREVVVRAWNGSRWEELGRTRGNAEGTVQITADLRDRHRHAGTVPILVTGEDPFADDLPNVVKDSFENPADYDFALAHLTDTQYLSEGAVEQETPEERKVWQDAYTDITQWIADNAAERKIAYTAHTGDIIENWHNVGQDEANARKEFEVASDAQKILEDAGMVNTVLPGNHDNLYGTDTGPDALYNDYFGPERFTAQAASEAWKKQGAEHHPWKADDNSNNYQLFSAGGLDFVVVSLGFGVTEEETAWADSVLKQFPDRNAVVLTHAYLTPSVNPDGRGSGFSYDGRQVMDRVIKKNPNVFLVLSGHEHGVSIEVRKDVGVTGNHVVELLADYQFYKVGSDEVGVTGVGGYGQNTPLQLGSSFFRLLQFDVDAGEMAVDTYSPLLKNFGATEYDDRKRYNGTEDDTRLPVQLQTRTTSFASDTLVVVDPTDEVIGAQTVRSGWPASVTWSGLSNGTTYAWQATSVDAESGEDLPGEVSQLSLFTAGKAGTDTRAPVLTVPGGATRVPLGGAFDPLAGVAATDEADGDLTDSIQVVGEVDTATPGVYSLAYTVTDANGNQAMATRAVTVQGAAAPVNTRRPVVSGPATIGSMLAATRGDWKASPETEYVAQWLRDGQPIPGATGGDYRLTAADIGRSIRVRITATTAEQAPVRVESNAVQVGKVKASVKAKVTGKARVSVKKRAVVKVAVRSGSVKATGTVVLKVKGREVTARLRNGVASVRLPKMATGRHTVTVRYLGDDKVSAAKTRTTFRVVRR